MWQHLLPLFILRGGRWGGAPMWGEEQVSLHLPSTCLAVAPSSHSATWLWAVLGTTGMLLQPCPAVIIPEENNPGANSDGQFGKCQAMQHFSGEVSPSRSRIIKWVFLHVCLCAHMRAYVTVWIPSLFCQNSTCQHKVKTKSDEVFWKYPPHWWAVSLPAFTA